jgi:hypothetical protein
MSKPYVVSFLKEADKPLIDPVRYFIHVTQEEGHYRAAVSSPTGAELPEPRYFTGQSEHESYENAAAALKKLPVNRNRVLREE